MSLGQMTTADRVRAARNPQEAMLAVAEAVDSLLDRLKTPEPDPWGAWGTENAGPPFSDESGTVPYEHYARQAYAAHNFQWDDAAIQATRDALATEADPETRQALEARLRLLTDDGATVAEAPQGARVQTSDDGSEITVDIPPPTPRRMELRRKFVAAAGLYDFSTQPILTREEYEDAYVKGGPMWLYLGDRDAVMAMPEQMRHILVADIEEDSPVQAQEVARDILKSSTAGEPETTMGRMYQ